MIYELNLIRVALQELVFVGFAMIGVAVAYTTLWFRIQRRAGK